MRRQKTNQLMYPMQMVRPKRKMVNELIADDTVGVVRYLMASLRLWPLASQLRLQLIVARFHDLTS